MRGSSDDGLRPVGEGLDEILGRLGLPSDFDMATLVREWDSVAGDPFQAHARPAGFREGELLLTVADGATATLLRYRAGELVDRLEDRFGKGHVRSIRIVVDRRRNGT